MVEGEPQFGFRLALASLARAWVDSMGQNAASHKSARAPRRVPRGKRGGREDRSRMVDSDDDDDDGGGPVFCHCFVSDFVSLVFGLLRVLIGREYQIWMV